MIISKTEFLRLKESGIGQKTSFSVFNLLGIGNNIATEAFQLSNGDQIEKTLTHGHLDYFAFFTKEEVDEYRKGKHGNWNEF